MIFTAAAITTALTSALTTMGIAVAGAGFINDNKQKA